MKGTFIIGKNNTLYKIRNNLITVKIRGSSNSVVNKFFNINDLSVYGNKNIVIVERFGKINCIKIFGNNNEIHINNKTFTRYLDYGEGNKFIRNRRSLAFNNRLELNNNTNRINNIFDKFEEKSYGNLPSPIKNENLSCSLCKKDFSEEEKVKICPCCSDIFHAGCLRNWIEHNMNSPRCPKCGHSINSFNLRNLDLFDGIIRFSPLISLHIQENNSDRNDDYNHHEPINHAPLVAHDRSDIYEFGEDEDEDGEEEEEDYDQESSSEFEGSIREKGLEKDIIDNMEIFEIKNVEKLDEEKNCLICFENNKDGDKCIALPCMHIFHADCIKTWLNKRGICPTCKHEIKYDYYDVENANF